MECAIAWPKEVSFKPAGLLETVALPSKKEHAAKQLSGSASDLVTSVVSIIDEMILSLLEKRTAEEFEQARDLAFPQYLSAMVALSALVKLAVPKPVFDRIVAESLSEQEADFGEHGAAIFGNELRNRGLFTVWTLRKISDLADKVREAQEKKVGSEELVKKFVASAVYARFHLDCLLKSIHAKRPIFPEIVDPLAEGLRSAVNAYALMRQMVDTPQLEPSFSVEWTEEDEVWLKDSMSDLAR